MNGFDRELRENILSVVPHVQIIHPQGIEDWPAEQSRIATFNHVTEVSPYNQVEGLINSRLQARPIQLLGLSSRALPIGIAKMLEEYQLIMPDAGQILLSEVVAEALNVSIKQSVSVIIPAENGRSTTRYSFVVEGIFATHTELDQSLVIASLPSRWQRLPESPIAHRGFACRSMISLMRAILALKLSTNCRLVTGLGIGSKPTEISTRPFSCHATWWYC